MSEGPAPGRRYTVGHYDAPREHLDPSPKVIVWYRVYAALMALASLGFLGGAAFFAWMQTRPEVAMQPHAADAQLTAMLLVFLGVAQLVFYAVGVLVPRRPWGWTYGLIVIGIGLPGLLTIPLLLFWLKLDAKAAFSRL